MQASITFEQNAQPSVALNGIKESAGDFSVDGRDGPGEGQCQIKTDNIKTAPTAEDGVLFADWLSCLINRSKDSQNGALSIA